MIVRERLRRWRGGDYKLLWLETVKLCKEQPRRKQGRCQQVGEVEGQSQEQIQEEFNTARVNTLAGEGQYSRAIQALTSLGMADTCSATEAELHRLQPAATRPLDPIARTEDKPLSFSQDDVLKQVNRFRKGSAPGPSGMRQSSKVHTESCSQQAGPCPPEPYTSGENHNTRQGAGQCGPLPGQEKAGGHQALPGPD